MFRGAAALLACTLASSACTTRNGDFRLDLPITASDRAAIIAAWDPDDVASARIYAIAIDDGGKIDPLAIPFDFTRGISIAAAIYADSLDALYLDEGPIPAPPPRTDVRPLPSTTRIFESTVGANGPREWTLGSVLPQPLAAVELPALSDCVEFTSQTYFLPTGRNAKFALGVNVAPAGLFSGDGALVATEGRQIFYVESSTVAELTPTTPEPCGDDTSDRAQYYSAYQDPSGPVWLVSRCGEVHRATVELASSRLSGGPEEAAPHRDTLASISGPSDADAKALFILSELGEIDVIDLASSISTMLTTLGDGEGQIAYVAEDEAVVAWSTTEDLVRIKAGATDTEPLPDHAAGAQPVRVARAGLLGMVAGNTAGEIYYRRSKTWRPLADPLDGRIEAITPYEKSVLVLDGQNRLRLYSTARRVFCEAVDVTPGPGNRAYHVAVIGRKILVAGEGGYYRWLEPR